MWENFCIFSLLIVLSYGPLDGKLDCMCPNGYRLKEFDQTKMSPFRTCRGEAHFQCQSNMEDDLFEEFNIEEIWRTCCKLGVNIQEAEECCEKVHEKSNYSKQAALVGIIIGILIITPILGYFVMYRRCLKRQRSPSIELVEV